MKRGPSDGQLAALNTRFADIVKSGEMRPAHATPAEVKDGDVPDLARIAFEPRHNFGRIRMLINEINAW